jgi:hypothetical protein
MLATCVRFCDDGTLRGPDNYIIARQLDGGWQVAGRMHRELQCEGPVRLRLMKTAREPTVMLGPFHSLHTEGGVLFGDQLSLGILMPGRVPGAKGCHQLTMFFEGELNGENQLRTREAAKGGGPEGAPAKEAGPQAVTRR